MIWVLALVGCVWISGKERTDRTDRDGDGAIDAQFLPDGDAAADCDDDDDTRFPSNIEVCNEIDDDCDGQVDAKDDGITDALAYHPDEDNDGFGDASVTVLACEEPFGLLLDDKDCDDAAPGTHPGVAEICDGKDQDCDGTIDEEPTDGLVFYADADGDGYGVDTDTTEACVVPDGFAANAGDCDETNELVHPSADEACDATEDFNCDGSTGNVDLDGDTFIACQDCDDGDKDQHPGAPETCNGEDDDCDALVDDEDPPVSGGTTSWPDDDGDGYGDKKATPVSTCNVPAGNVEVATDCDDSDARVHPGVIDICDGADSDCDGKVDACDLQFSTFPVVEGVAANDRAGGALAAGDVDGDGNDDLVIGAAASATGGTGAGAVYLRLGPIEPGSLLTTDATWLGDKSSAAGTSVTVFDTDASGLFDVGIGGKGKAWVLVDPDGASKLQSADATITGASSLGAAVAGGNADGDSKADLVVTANLLDDSLALRAGAAFVYAGPVRGSLGLSQARSRITGGAIDAQLGARAGWVDTDADGVAELFVPRSTNLLSNVTEVLVYEDPRGNLGPGDAIASVKGSANGDDPGTALDGGDVDGDGKDDLFVGADAAGGTGRAYVFRGPVSGTNQLGTALVRMDGTSGSKAGAAMSAVDDLDQDGTDEILVGAPGANTAYLVYGGVTGSVPLAGAALRVTGTASEVGAAVVSGDFDADFASDLAVGAPARTSSAGGVAIIAGAGL